ncbi:MAG TPA: bifunctional pyr operon transcriptional regulator/uracil phosphoribosyltransferase PyrR [Holophagaceae bacterium]|nr:bifunctional pyr operon transcriptional regulator/uracil phosphoribosyltransferase PyrR [Holophagaceae bacterium]
MTGPCQLDPAQMEAALQRLAGEVAQRLGQDNLVLLGIRSRGLPLAERLGAALSKALGREIPVGALDITLYRDDLTELVGVPIVRPTEIPFTLKDRTILLVDDVLFTGRTIRAALDALLDHGRPKTVRLAVLVDRGGRELPIQADFTAVTLPVTGAQRVSVKVKELDGEDGVFLETRG